MQIIELNTIKVIFKILDKYQLFRVRLLRINSPEIRGGTPEIKKNAIISRDYLRSLILNKLVLLDCGDFDNFGRLLAEVYIWDDGQQVNNLMLEGGYATPYEK